MLGILLLFDGSFIFGKNGMNILLLILLMKITDIMKLCSYDDNDCLWI